MNSDIDWLDIKTDKDAYKLGDNPDGGYYHSGIIDR